MRGLLENDFMLDAFWQEKIASTFDALASLGYLANFEEVYVCRKWPLFRKTSKRWVYGLRPST
jgi:hypothetical protein